MSSSPIRIAFVSASGGVGKTKLSLSLAWWLYKNRNRVLILDLDPTAGLSLLVLDEHQYIDILERERTLTKLIDDATRGYNRDITNYTINLGASRRENIVSMNINIIVPGETLVAKVTELFSGFSGNPARRFANIIMNRLPPNKWSFMIIDSAPFFDPRYTTLSLNLADWVVIPIRPTLIDLIRTHRMLKILQDEMDMKRTIILFNMVPTGNAVEAVFVKHVKENTLGSYESRNPKLVRRYESLKTWFERIISEFQVKYLRNYIPRNADIDRFPDEGTEKNFEAKTNKTLEELYKIIKSK